MKEWLTMLLGKTAWQMTPPRAYGTFHLLFMLLGFSACVIAALAMRRVSARKYNRLVFAIGIFLVLSEFYKQLFYTFYLEGGEYQWWIFPFQLCSIPMYACLVLPFLKKGKLRRAITGFLCTFNLLGGFLTFFEPSGISHPYWTLTLHAYLWHMLLVFLGFSLLARGEGCRSAAEFRLAVYTFLVLCAAAFCINLIFYAPSGGTINMFFVGPADSTLIFCKDIAARFGWYVSTLLYVPAVCFGAYIVYLLGAFVTKPRRSR